MEEKGYFVSTDNAERVGAYMMIFDHYFANYRMHTQLNKRVKGKLIIPSFSYVFYSDLDKKTEEAIRHDIRQLENPPSLRLSSDGSDYLFGLRAY